MSIKNKLKELNYELPIAPKAIGNYETFIQVDKFIYTSGVLPVQNGELLFNKKITNTEDSINYGYKAAELCVLNVLSIIDDSIGIDNIEKVIKITGFVNSSEGFNAQPKVINGASDTLVKIMGEAGKHARSAVGVNELPIGASVEVEFIFKLK